MASEADIRRMLIDALRPSLLEIVQQELSRVVPAVGPAASESCADARSHEAYRRELERRIGERLAEVEAQLTSIKEELSATRNQDLERVERLAEAVVALEQRLKIAGSTLRHELLQLQPIEPSESERAESGAGQGRRSSR